MPSGPKSIDSLRTYYHSNHEHERTEVIQILGSLSGEQPARELIQLYQECQWQNSRLQIIRVLSQNPTFRGLEFLFERAQEESNLPIAEMAIRSLGQSRHRLAATFLAHFYLNCSEVLKPTVVSALGQIHDRTRVQNFIRDLPIAIENQNFRLAKNLILTLGELKVNEALSILKSIIQQKTDLEMKLSTLISIGKIARDPNILEPLAHHFSDDLFQYQFFTAIQTQIEFRSKWKLEDYLRRLFESNDFHESIYFELNHFDPKDVKEGLRLFDQESNFEKLCIALSRLDFPNISTWYTDLFTNFKLNTSHAERLLQSLSVHPDASTPKILSQIMKNHPESWPSYLSALAYSPTAVEHEFKIFFGSDFFKNLEESARVFALNPLYLYGLCIQSHPEKLQVVGQIFDALLETDLSIIIHSRILRALGDLNIRSKKALSLIKKCLEKFRKGTLKKNNQDLLLSSLRYLQKCPRRNLLAQLVALVENTESLIFSEIEVPYLKALTALPLIPEIHPKLDQFLKDCLLPKSPRDRVLATLNFLQIHPRPDLLSTVIEKLKPGRKSSHPEPLILAAIIALKSFRSEKAVEPIAKLLHSKQKSIAGRALDTLSVLPGPQAKTIMIDYLFEHRENLEISQKILQSLDHSEHHDHYLQKTLEEILIQLPSYPLKDGIIRLQEKCQAKKQKQPSTVANKGLYIHSIDQQLSKYIVGYDQFNDSIKSVLRSAELPYQHPELFDEYVDKASSIIEYCKSLDLFMEKTIGKEQFFPKLERSLHEFQNIIHSVGLNEFNPNPVEILKALHLEIDFTVQSLPLHKMTLISQDILSGKIIYQPYKTLDGLRAWAVVLLLFGRSLQNRKPLIILKGMTEKKIIHLCKRLIDLQEVRNPFAHRQTALKFDELDAHRQEVFSILSHLLASMK